MKGREKDRIKDSNDSKPLSKESAKARYETESETEAKGSKESIESLVEAKIRKAMAAGEFDNLKGKGEPIDLEKYYGMPEHLRLGYHVLKNTGYLPEEIRLKNEMESIKEKIKTCTSDKEKLKLMKELTETSQQFHFHMEYNRKFKKPFS